MGLFKSFFVGALSVLHVTSRPMLYRYPYRISAQGIRADWQKIAGDIESVMGKIKAEGDHGEE